MNFTTRDTRSLSTISRRRTDEWSAGDRRMLVELPPEMQQVGTAMHRAASELGVIAQEAAADGDLRRAMGAPAQVTQQCVACHAVFRIR